MSASTKYIFVTGGVTSSLGKGIISASLAKLLQARGYRVTIQKLDPYINIDPGTLNPYEHGECFVTEDGAETDLDLGHYERFLNISTSRANNITTGRIYQSVIDKERIISNINRLKVPLGEAKFHSKETLKKMIACSKTSIEALKKDLARVDKLINSVIQENLDLKRSYSQITSVDGLGPMTAIMILICTGNFKKINDPKKFACYSGVAPFPHSSGKSLRGRSKVSHLANKSMKTLLHMASISAIQREGDIKEYYYRKVDEGKNKMLVLNAIRNKLITRAFACVRENRCFEKKLQVALA